MPVIGNIGWTNEQREQFHRMFDTVHPAKHDPPPNVIYDILCPAIRAQWSAEEEELRSENITRPS